MANPPIVIGPFDNVPAPGSPVRSDWPQEISHYVIDVLAVTRTQGFLVYPTTDANGFFRVNLPAGFSGTLNAVSIICADPGLGLMLFQPQTFDASGFYCFAKRVDGSIIANAAISAHVIAVGPR
jgi:hypothetical protein